MAARRRTQSRSRRDPRTQFVRGSGYRIPRLTKREFATLEWLSDRGYDGGILEAAGVEEEYPDGSVQLGDIPEPAAWEIHNNVEEDPGAFLSSSGSEGLNDKLIGFLDAIV